MVAYLKTQPCCPNVKPSPADHPPSHLHHNPATTRRVYSRGFHTLILFVAFHGGNHTAPIHPRQHPRQKYLQYPTITTRPAHIKERARVATIMPSLLPAHHTLWPASLLARLTRALARVIFDSLPFGLRLQHILSSDASKFVGTKYPIHKTLKQQKQKANPKRKAKRNNY